MADFEEVDLRTYKIDSEKYEALYRDIWARLQGEPLPRVMSALVNIAVDAAQRFTRPSISVAGVRELVCNIIDSRDNERLQ